MHLSNLGKIESKKPGLESRQMRSAVNDLGNLVCCFLESCLIVACP